METLLIILLAILLAIVVLAIGAWVLWKRVTREERRLIKRVTGLRLGSKLRLAGRLMRDERVPLAARAALPVLVLYLALPIDFIPDVIPVIGLLDDVFMLVVGLHLLLRFTPRPVIEAHLETLEHQDLDARAIEAGQR
jgi:uncharacterized membrane protein YkvA (DUF1232 family)